ncbi:MAG TPA: efflux RND transporter periplasmic adaptor subunit, partial [Verrucomicrobiae bacterium]|nr:efflux RND transporter periplasmic adaptor subunit [Verrucomicrobiae bacterium]
MQSHLRPLRPLRLAPWLLAAIVAACGKQESPDAAAAAPAKPVLSIEVVSPRAESWPGTVGASGAIAPWQEASVGSELGGIRLEEVRVNVGDRVQRGQLLARFSDETLKADLAQLDAVVAERQAALDKARLEAESADRLESSGGLSKQQARSVRTQAVVADAQLASAKAQRDAQALRLRYARVLAPDDGVISARSATVGAVVTPGVELFRLIRGGRLEWRAEVRSDALARLRKGTLATIKLPHGAAISGRVRQVAPTVDPATLNGIAYVDFPATPGLAAGLFVSGEFELAATDVLVVPASAVVFRSGSRYVMQVGDDSRIHEAKVETGRRRGADVEVLTGIAPGARLALAGGAFLNDGDLVAISASKTAATEP